MDNIELFDKYIKNELSQREKEEFDAKLKSDNAFAQDFKIYSTTVIGICNEAEQDNLEFGMAMKRLTKEQLQDIIGPQKESKPVIAKTLKFKPWIWQAASIAAILVIAFTAVFKIQQQARYDVYDAIYACADKDLMEVRSGQEASLNIDNLSIDELKAEIPNIVQRYENATDEQEVADNGYILTMAYLRLHDKNNAQKALESLVYKFKDNPDYAADVKNWESILNLIK